MKDIVKVGEEIVIPFVLTEEDNTEAWAEGEDNKNSFIYSFWEELDWRYELLYES